MSQVSFTLEVSETQTVLVPENHQYTLIWLHGLNETPQKHLAHMLTSPLINTLKNFRVVLPKAPKRFVTAQKTEMNSWFDIKFRDQTSFLVDFDEAFSSAQVKASYQQILKPLIEQEDKLLASQPRRIFIGGFSQGCGMSLHCLYSTKIEWAGAIGVSGYLFPITPFSKQLDTPKRIVYGTQDDLRKWEYVKVTYEGKFPPQEIMMVQGVGHEMKPDMINQISRFLNQTIATHLQ